MSTGPFIEVMFLFLKNGCFKLIETTSDIRVELEMSDLSLLGSASSPKFM